MRRLRRLCGGPQADAAHITHYSPFRYNEAVVEEGELPPEQRAISNVGKMDARKHLAAAVSNVMGSNINQVRWVNSRGAERRQRISCLGHTASAAACRPHQIEVLCSKPSCCCSCRQRAAGSLAAAIVQAPFSLPRE